MFLPSHDFNIILATDSYKTSHWSQYPRSARYVYSYCGVRSGEYAGALFFGLQYPLSRYFTGQVVTPIKIDQAQRIIGPHMSNPGIFNHAGWDYILKVHNGRLPLRICAIPEGTIVNTEHGGNALFTIENTDPNVPWLVNYMETLLMQTWYPTAVASLSRHCMEIIRASLARTSDTGLDSLVFKLHDFGFRGAACVESAALGGAAHLINFRGTDTMPALMMVNEHYRVTGSHGTGDWGVAGWSIPATEHSTITSWGREGELDAYRNLLAQFPDGLVACVSDSYDIYNACRKLWGEALKEQVMSRNGTLVVRPDSGDPLEVVPKVLEILGERFGYGVNAKGYKVLPPQVRMIQGDGVTPRSIAAILDKINAAGWSTENIAFGMGGALLQRVDRDKPCNMAIKCSSVGLDNGNGGIEWRDVYKDPVTDPGKRSYRGRLNVYQYADGRVVTLGTDQAIVDSPEAPVKSLLRPVFENGELLRDDFDLIRKRADANKLSMVRLNK